MKSREAVPALIRALQDEDALVRGHAAWALGQIGSEASFKALTKRFEVESEAEVREELEEAITKATLDVGTQRQGFLGAG